jgi:hypothetical protein
MESLNEINGMVEQNQWIGCERLAVLLSETDNLMSQDW